MSVWCFLPVDFACACEWARAVLRGSNMYAFEVTVEDVQQAMNCGEAEADEFFDSLDFDAIEGAALYGQDIEEQTRYAYAEIRRQLGAEP